MLTENIFHPTTERLLATHIFAVPNDNAKVKTEFVTDNSHSIQVGILHRTAGTLVNAHQHLPTQKVVTGTQEVLIVKSGHIVVDIFDDNGEFVSARALRTGDVYIQYSGGHAFSFITDVQFIEIKQGPYTPSDKVYFNPTAHEQTK
jgi:cupin fold WbuC family metalloprotein